MSIRIVNTNEVNTLQSFARMCFIDAFASLNTQENMALYLKDHLTIEQTKEEIQNKNTRFFFTEQDNQIVAYAKINQHIAQSEQQLSNALEVERIYVHPDWQGRQIGAQLLKHLINLGRIERFDHIWLGVWQENKAAIRFYQRHGFTTFSQHGFYLGNDLQTDLMMKLSF